MTQPELPAGLKIDGQLARIEQCLHHYTDPDRYGQWSIVSGGSRSRYFGKDGKWHDDAPFSDNQFWFPTREVAVEFACRHADLPDGWTLKPWRSAQHAGYMIAKDGVADCEVHPTALAAYLAIMAAQAKPAQPDRSTASERELLYSRAKEFFSNVSAVHRAELPSLLADKFVQFAQEQGLLNDWTPETSPEPVHTPGSVEVERHAIRTCDGIAVTKSYAELEQQLAEAKASAENHLQAWKRKAEIVDRLTAQLAAAQAEIRNLLDLNRIGGEFQELAGERAAQLAALRSERQTVVTLADHDAAVSKLEAQLAELRTERDALAKFKAFVHRRLDSAGIPTHPDGPHSKEGCRIGDRLDIALEAQARATTLEEALREAADYFGPRERWDRITYPDAYRAAVAVESALAKQEPTT